MKTHRSLSHTVIPPTYRPETCPKKLTDGLNKWYEYIHRENKKLK